MSASPSTIPSDAEAVLVTGRVDRSEEDSMGVAYQWSGIEFAVGLACPAASSLGIVLTLAQQETLDYTIECEAKGTVSGRIIASDRDRTPTPKVFNVTSDGVKGECVARIRKASETWECNAPTHGLGSYVEKAPSYFHGFEASDGCTARPVSASDRRIEVVGDSISCGYGNLFSGNGSSSLDSMNCMRNNGAWATYEDQGLAYGPLLAAHFGAAYHTQCISGMGVTRSAPRGGGGGGGDAWTPTTTTTARKIRAHGTTMSLYLDRALPCVAGAAPWVYTTWRPDVVLLNLGTNDFILGPAAGSPSRSDFEAAFVALATRLLTQYAPAPPPLVVVCGPMTVTQCPYVASAVTTLQEAGWNATMVNTTLDGTPRDLKGCGGHPTAIDHGKIASMIAPAIRIATGWK